MFLKIAFHEYFTKITGGTFIVGWRLGDVVIRCKNVNRRIAVYKLLATSNSYCWRPLWAKPGQQGRKIDGVARGKGCNSEVVYNVIKKLGLRT